uniref:Uncharacterized protein n=3 Tax=Meloidogyne TaxID=189290 RepID=A0A914MT02_MELIC|nr:unnamed protein product [Meloidogyne enterolobii]
MVTKIIFIKQQIFNIFIQKYLQQYSLFLFILFLVKIPENALALDCIQCDRQALWYSPEENERHISRCQKGLIPSTKCMNSSHTHCIYSYYRQSGVITVTERRCGTVEEISGCTLYKSLRRAKRHFIGGTGTDINVGNSPASHRRRETGPLVVEVCTSGCQEDGCVSGGIRQKYGEWTVLGFLLTTILVLRYFNGEEMIMERRRK